MGLDLEMFIDLIENDEFLAKLIAYKSQAKTQKIKF